MNDDVIKGKWKEIKGEAQRQWGKLTNDDLDQINGSLLKLEGRLQEKYGYSKEKAQEEAERWAEDRGYGVDEPPRGNF